MTFDFRAELDVLAKRIKRDSRLDLLVYAVQAPLTGQEIRTAEDRLGSSLPEPVRGLYSSIGGASISWRFRPDIDEQTRAQVINDFDHAVTRNEIFETAGSINIIPLRDMLFSEEYALPESEADEGEFEFDSVTYSDNDFCRMLRPFDIVSDFFAMAFVVQPGRPNWKMMWLSDYWVQYDSSEITYLDDYLKYIIATLGLISAREELFGGCHDNHRDVLRFDVEKAVAKVPRALNS